MWKTLGGFTAQISRFQHILPLSTAQINCSGSDLPFFRKPYLIQALSEVKSSLNTLAARHGNLHLYSGFDILCPASSQACVNHVKGGFTYRDGSHLNNRGSGLLAQSFETFIGRLNK
jgi:hypothetical protein